MAADAESAARSARIEAAAQHAAPALAPLPPALVLHILSLLPVDARLRCAEVCRSWRAALEERSLWIRLDLTASGVSPKREVTGALLHAAVARARGELVALDLRDCALIMFDALLAVVTANGGALRELRCQPIRPGAGHVRAGGAVARCATPGYVRSGRDVHRARACTPRAAQRAAVRAAACAHLRVPSSRGRAACDVGCEGVE
jgi:hypothetical protein